MYARQFGLTQDPFSIAPDPRFLFMSERHREALAHLLFGVTGAGGGFVLLTGEIGTGKTTICRCFLEQIPPGCHVAYIFNPKLSVMELLQSIREEFHVAPGDSSALPPTVKDHVDALNAFLLHSHAAGQNCVLVIDEAQNLAPDVLEQLRLLTNLETSERKLLQIVLIGQPELRSMLASSALEQLAQRVIARYHLDALTQTETLQYIAHRLAVAGHVGRQPFDDAALKRIHQLSKGIPRRINLLCGRAMLGAWANGLDHVNRKGVAKAASEVFGAEQIAPKDLSDTAQPWIALALLCAVVVVSIVSGWPSLAPWASKTSSPMSVASEVAAPIVIPAAPAVSAPMQASSGVSPKTELTNLESAEDLDRVLPLLPRDINVAWHELGKIWKLPISESDLCDVVAISPLQCYRNSKLSVSRIRQLDRPGIMTLQKGNAAPVHAVLVGLNDQTAALSIEGATHVVRWVALSQLWQGGFATYWRAPKGYIAELQDGSTGPAVEQLSQQLSKLDGFQSASGKPMNQKFDEVLRARVRAFQSAHGMKPDGVPGALTFMQLESATGSMGAADPRLTH